MTRVPASPFLGLTAAALVALAFRLRHQEVRYRDRQRHHHRLRRRRSGQGRDPHLQRLGGGAPALPRGPRPRRAAPSPRRPRAVRAGGGRGPVVRHGALPARRQLGHRQGLLRAPEGRRRRSPSQASEGERLMILALEAGGNAKPAQGAGVSEGAGGQVSRTTSGPTSSSAAAGSASRSTTKAIEQYRKAIEINPALLAGVQPAGLRLPPGREVRRRGGRLQEVHRADPGRPQPVRLVRRAADEDGAVRRVDRPVPEGARASTPTSRRRGSGIATNLMLQGKHAEGAKEMDGLYAAARDDGERRNALFTKGGDPGGRRARPTPR